MMPSRARLASATAAGVVGLAVAGLILFGTDPLGTGTTVIAVPAPAGASGEPTATAADPETEPTEDEGADDAAASPNRRPWRPGPTTTAGEPRRTYRPGPWTTATYRPPTTYGPRPVWRPTHRPTTRPRPSASSTAPTTRPTTTPPSATPTRSTATPTPRPTAAPSTTSPTPSATPSPTTASPTPTTASPTPTGSYASRTDWAAAVLDRLNAQRADHGLAALSTDSKLTAAAHAHNVRMADADQLSHQLPGEPGLGARISDAGYSWRSVGENVAWNSNRSQAGVLALQDSMYNETPPDDGHRRNILSTSFTEVGIDVIEDTAHGKVWLVTDFGRP